MSSDGASDRAGLSNRRRCAHIRPMADSNDKISAPKGARGAYRKRGSPLTDYMDASEPLEPGGFGEAPQPELSGVPLSGSVSDWAEQIAREAEREGRQRPSPLEGAGWGVGDRMGGKAEDVKQGDLPDKASRRGRARAPKIRRGWAGVRALVVARKRPKGCGAKGRREMDTKGTGRWKKNRPECRRRLHGKERFEPDGRGSNLKSGPIVCWRPSKRG